VYAATSRTQGFAIQFRPCGSATGGSPAATNTQAQSDALRAAGCEEIFLNKASGKLTRRPELDKALLSANRTGDQSVITKLDRLERSLEHLIELSNQLQTKKST
jgi:DNA invertase Pin-like site-specific DNA recombinase